jgi:KAP family P-loop domain
MENNAPIEPSIKYASYRQLSSFADDELGVQKIADIIESIVANLLGQPFVIGINSPWGTGKTEFLRMWKKRLDDGGWRVIAFNAWENDFLEDPLKCLLGELSGAFEASNKSRLLPSWKGVKDAAKYLVKKSVPGAVKHATLGAIDIDGVGNVMADAASDAAEEAIKTHHQTKDSLIAFREKLGELATQVAKDSNHPLLIIVDELDRCRPNFAIEMLEVIKHLFDVENVVFILAYDGHQLACSTQSLYGQNFDGKTYLQRFFNLEFNLPVDTAIFLENESKRVGLSGWEKRYRKPRPGGTSQDVLQTLRAQTMIHQFSLRTAQRILTKFSVVVATIDMKQPLYAHVLSPLVVLSVVNPELLAAYFRDELDWKAIAEVCWPKERLAQLSSDTVYETTLTWCFASSVFFLFYMDRSKSDELRRRSTQESSDDGFLSHWEGCRFFERIKNAYNGYSKRFDELDFWNTTSKRNLQQMLTGSNGINKT